MESKKWEKKEKINRRKGIIFAIGFHAAILLLFIILGLTTPYPPPSEEGILINFGTVDAGAGELQPQQNEEKVTPEHQTAPESVETPENTEVETQDVEEAPSLDKEKEEKPAEPEKPKETEKEVKKEEEKPEVDPDALYKGNPNKSDSEGDKNKPGDQGSEKGDKEKGAYTGDESFGKGSTGIGFDLAGRKMIGVPEINDKSQSTGKVVIRIKVDKNGNVLSAEFRQKGSTTTDSYLVSLAMKAAREARFNSDPYGAEVQFGTITFTFKVK